MSEPGGQAVRAAGPFEALWRRTYERSPAGFLGAVARRHVIVSVLTAIVGVLTTALYIDMSLREMAILLAAGLTWYLLDAALAARALVPLAAPVRAWLDGERGDEAATAAWCAGASLPWRLLRRRLPYALGFLAAVTWDAIAGVVLDLSLAQAAAIVPGSFALFLYWSVLRLLALELAMRPVLEDVSAHLPIDAALDVPSVSLRWRLVVALPAVSWGTGVVVGGITVRLGEGAGTLGLAIVAALLVTVCVSIFLGVTLADAVSGPVAGLGVAARRLSEGDLDVHVPVASTDEVGDAARSFNTMVRGLHERERLREAFGAYVDPALAERVLAEGTDVRGQEVVVSVLFVDVRGFTTFSEQSDARTVVSRLNELYEEVVPAILRHGGHANKFIGDGLLAVFGAPDRLTDHADRAVAAACEVARVVEKRFEGSLRVGVGVNSGPVVAGTIGGGGRVDFTVIGDTVNTAARVEAATRETGDDVLVTEATVSMLQRDGVRFEERPVVPLKGKEQPVRLLAPG